ncbi:MAG TPA: chloride channel protein [Nitrospiria bacterium]|nr:chloride channel protein [Nitrospiria bacterium]
MVELKHVERPVDLDAESPAPPRPLSRPRHPVLQHRIIVEQGTLLLSIFKWTGLAAMVGVLVGGSTGVFLLSLGAAIDLTSRLPYFFLLLPLALFLSGVMIHRFAPEARGHGTEMVIWAVHRKDGQIDPRVVPVKLLATILTIAFGGSAGKEGPCAQIGAGLAAAVSNLIRLSPHDRKKLVICGIAAGFSGVFGTPVAGALFAVEVLVLGQLLYDVLYPSFVAGIIGYHVTNLMGVTYFHHPITLVPVLTGLVFLKVLLAGLFFGGIALILILLIQAIVTFVARWNVGIFWKSLAGGGFLAGLAFLVGTDYLGLGLSGIEQAVEGKGLPIGSFLWKSLATAVTLGTGSGGIITPIFFIGAAAGDLWGRIMGMDRGTFAALGMIAVLAGAANTPIAASVMAIELFGPALAPYAAVACVASFLITGHRSVYPSQVIGMAKSESLQIGAQTEIGQIDQVQRIGRPGKLVSILEDFYRRLRK